MPTAIKKTPDSGTLTQTGSVSLGILIYTYMYLLFQVRARSESEFRLGQHNAHVPPLHRAPARAHERRASPPLDPDEPGRVVPGTMEAQLG